ISGNHSNGVDILSDGNVVQGNRIGTDVSGTQPLANVGSGIYILNATGNLVGGTTAGAGNVIAFNNGEGGRVYGAGSTGNIFEANSIFANTGLGINLLKNNNLNDGVTANDVLDVDTGPNNLQNYPEQLSAVTANGQTVIQGVLGSTLPGKFR